MNVEKLNNHRQEWFYFMPGVSCGHDDTCSFLYGTLHVLYFLCFFKFQKIFRHWTYTTIIYTWSASDSVSPLMLKTLSLLRLLTWCEYLEVIRWSLVGNFIMNQHVLKMISEAIKTFYKYFDIIFDRSNFLWKIYSSYP